MEIRREVEADYPAIQALNAESFESEGEAKLVDELRRNGHLLLSLVALENGHLVGHIAFSPMRHDDAAINLRAAGLAPMAVSPFARGRGIGKALVEQGLAEMSKGGMEAVFVLGHETYYPRFGFKPAAQYGIRSVYPDAEENFFALELTPDALDKAGGLVHYSPEFGKL